MTWYKIFYWMRLFNNFAFFINLLSRTFSDKYFVSFMTMLIILTLAIANMVYIFNKKRGDYYEDFQSWDDRNLVNKRIFEEDMQSNFMSAIIFAYKLCLGEFETSGFPGHHERELWIIFFIATFLLQITFLNMLIAIMSNTFDRVMETKQQSAMRERIAILADFRLVLRKLLFNKDFSYIYVITPLI